MEYVKQAWVYRFWIVLGVVLLLPIIGYFVDTSGLADEANAMRNQLTNEKKMLTDLASKTNPNDSWTQKVQELHSELKQEVDGARKALWDRQKEFMKWPGDYGPIFEKAGKDGMVPPAVCLSFKEPYQAQFDKILESMRAVVPDTGLDKGALVIDVDQVYKFEAPWTDLPTAPTASQIWQAQEDVWILRAIADVLAKANQDSKHVKDSAIKGVSFIAIGADAVEGDESATGRDLLPFAYGKNSSAPTAKGKAEGRYLASRNALDDKLYQLVPVYLNMKVDQRRVADILAQFASSGIPMRVNKVRFTADPQSEDAFQPVSSSTKRGTLQRGALNPLRSQASTRSGQPKQEDAPAQKGKVPPREDEYFHMADLRIWAHAYLFRDPENPQ